MKLSSSSLSAVTVAPSIFDDIDFLCGSNSVSYPLAQKLRNVNKYYQDVTTAIISAQSNWEWDDTNYSTYPIGTTTLVASQKDYILPTNMLKILRIEVKDAGGNYQKVQQFDEQEVGQGLSEFNKSDGLPLYYREVANSIELYPAPSASDVTLAQGLKVYYERAVTEFGVSDADTEPGFAEPFHRILSLGPSYDYAYVNEIQNGALANRLKLELQEKFAALKEYYSSRNREVRPKLKVIRRNYE